MNSIANSFPSDGRVVKAIIYLHDCPPGGGANGIIVGSNRLPFTPAEVYGTQFYSGTEATRGDKSLPLDKMPNSIGFTLPAGWAAIFDITSWHTALANNGPGQACLAGCVLNVCGDGDKGPTEDCDDNNTISGDGCSSTCDNEKVYETDDPRPGCSRESAATRTPNRSTSS